ncbi:MAG TPA: hypothetical protein VM287_05380, partial [Egibacteraceae bacterium]|nr:hypothetical protein [Egibacteraceae bacterium]
MNSLVRKTAAGALSAAATAMKLGARISGQVAEMLRTPEGQRTGATPEKTDEVLEIVGQDRQTDAAARATVTEPPTEPSPAGPSHVRTSETHVEELASGTASEVIAAIPDLSTEELGRLHEHESANKNRKTVLAAIERAGHSHAP